MGVKSIENIDRLYWLGRYSERVYITIKLYRQRYDSMVKEGAEDHDAFCEYLDIPNIYSSVEEFRTKYPFGQDNPNSIYSNLKRAHDNAIELREEIGRDTLEYIQLAVYEMDKAAVSDAPMVEFQNMLDHILAFWSIVDDRIEDEEIRNIIKVGKRVERIDLYGRLKADRSDMRREVHSISGHIIRTGIHYNKQAIIKLNQLINEHNLTYFEIVKEIEMILDE